VINAPLALIADMAVPGALIAFGISLRGAPIPGRGGRAADLSLAAVLKLALMPVVAYSVGRWAFGMGGTALLAATMCAALPTAQNVFVYAVRYRVAVPLARDAVATTTLLCIPVLVIIAGLLS
jgi:malonate transporter and related proteins